MKTAFLAFLTLILISGCSSRKASFSGVTKAAGNGAQPTPAPTDVIPPVETFIASLGTVGSSYPDAWAAVLDVIRIEYLPNKLYRCSTIPAMVLATAPGETVLNTFFACGRVIQIQAVQFGNAKFEAKLYVLTNDNAYTQIVGSGLANGTLINLFALYGNKLRQIQYGLTAGQYQWNVYPLSDGVLDPLFPPPATKPLLASVTTSRFNASTGTHGAGGKLTSGQDYCFLYTPGPGWAFSPAACP